LDYDVMVAAAKKGHLECMRYLIDKRCPGTIHNAYTNYGCIYRLLENGHLDCVREINRQTINLALFMQPHNYRAAVLSGKVEYIQYLFDMGCPFASTQTCAYQCAAAIGNVAMIKYMYELGLPRNNIPEWEMSQSLECIQYMHEHGFPWSLRTYHGYAMKNNLDCMRYAHEHGCPWNRDALLVSAEKGNLECMLYALEHGCPGQNLVCKVAAQHGNLNCLQCAHEHGCPWDHDTTVAAAQHAIKTTDPSFACLKYANEHGCPFSVLSYSAAHIIKSSAGHLYLIEQGIVVPTRASKINKPTK
jgi:hypothetical protein